MSTSQSPRRQPLGHEEHLISRARPRSFFRAPICGDISRLNADVAFIGIPFDQGTLYRPGARYGPNGIRDTLGLYDYTDPWEELEAEGYFDIDAGGMLLQGITMADCGDVTILPADVERNLDKITRTVRQILNQSAFPVIVGGDHSITFPAVRAFDRYQPLDVVHLDAHQDFTHDLQGVKHHHGCPIRRVRELPFVGNITSLGVRKARRDVYQETLEMGVKTITTDQFRTMGPTAAAQAVPQAKYIYVSLDIDVLDSIYAPGTGSPYPGGLTFFEVRDFLWGVLRRGQVVGLDIVEVAPPYDWAQITCLTAAKLILDFLSRRFPSRPPAQTSTSSEQPKRTRTAAH